MRARGMPYNRMIPKSGYRFSDKIMRKRQSTTPPSIIASRLNRRWDRFFGSVMLGELYSLRWVSLRSTHPTNNKQKGSRTRPGACLPMVRTIRARFALIAARSPDGVPPRHLRPRANAAAQLQNALPGTRLSAGVIRRLLSQSSDKVADRSSMPAGRFPVSRPGAEVTSPCPREPLLPRRPMSPGRRPLVGKIR